MKELGRRKDSERRPSVQDGQKPFPEGGVRHSFSPALARRLNRMIQPPFSIPETKL